MTVTDDPGDGPMSRVEDVLAAWFEENLTYEFLRTKTDRDLAEAVAAALAAAGIAARNAGGAR